MPRSKNISASTSTTSTPEIAFGRVVKKRRQQLGLTQADLEGEDGIERSYISRIESGKTQVCLRGIIHLAEKLQMTPGELLDRAMNLRT